MKFKLVPVLLAVLTCTILVKLGFWQLQRAQQKQQALAMLQQQQQVQLAQWLASSDKSELHSRRVALWGLIETEQVWLLDNRVYQGQVGYNVITKFRLASTEHWVWVDWGWIKAPAKRSDLPEVVLPTEPLLLTGLIKSQELQQVRLKATSEQGWPRRIQTLQELHIQDAIIYADLGLIDSAVQTYQPVVMPPEKHKAYALQWFLLALACVLIFLFASRDKGETDAK